MEQLLFFCTVTFIIAFLLGSIPWGVIISRLFYHTDIREHGSGNIGTTNAYRTMGAVGGSAVFVLDFLKGVLAGWLAMVFSLMLVISLNNRAATAVLDNLNDSTVLGFQLTDPGQLSNLAAHAFGLVSSLGLLGAMCGHIFSPWLRFRGGKGVAVAAGSLLFIFGLPGLMILVAVFALMTVITRYVSVGSISAALIAPFVAFWVAHGEPCFVVLLTIACGLVIWAHRGNIARLKAGNENRIGRKKGQADREIAA
jgi:glycerol-3-phosphate acyltransferase PlsY